MGLFLTIAFNCALAQRQEQYTEMGYPLILNKGIGLAFIGYGLSFTYKQDSICQQPDFFESFIYSRISGLLNDRKKLIVNAEIGIMGSFRLISPPTSLHIIDGLMDIGYCKFFGDNISRDNGIAFSIGLRHTDARIQGGNYYIKYGYQTHSFGTENLDLHMILIGAHGFFSKPTSFR